jgi:hypothetical protein
MMLDTKHPLMEGGCGQTFDWTVAKECQQARPMFIAGGLGPDNVAGYDCLRKPSTLPHTHPPTHPHTHSNIAHTHDVGLFDKVARGQFWSPHAVLQKIFSANQFPNVFCPILLNLAPPQNVCAWSGPLPSTPAAAWRPPKG